MSLDVKAGEIVGIYGLVGTSRTEFAETVFGVGERQAGDVFVDGQRLANNLKRLWPMESGWLLKIGFIGNLQVAQRFGECRCRRFASPWQWSIDE